MAAKKATPKKTSSSPTGAQAVDDFLRTLDHPLKPEIEAVRRIILGADPRIGEGIKWNAPSFCIEEWFATFHLRAQGFVHVILHRGAKVKDNTTGGAEIADPSGLLEWLAKERAAVKFHDMADIAAKREAFERVVRAWVA